MIMLLLSSTSYYLRVEPPLLLAKKRRVAGEIGATRRAGTFTPSFSHTSLVSIHHSTAELLLERGRQQQSEPAYNMRL